MKPTVGHSVMLACQLEAAVPKPGNVHRGADFSDTTFYDFLVSAFAVGQVFEQSQLLSVGELILRSVEATQSWVGRNTNLGILLLMAPLARAAALDRKVSSVLNELTADDCDLVYQAIRLAEPGGIGSEPDQDVMRKGESPTDLVAAMQLARERDTIALQYCTGYAELHSIVVPSLESELKTGSLVDGVIRAFLKTMATLPDSLIQRKLGIPMAEQASVRAQQLLEIADPEQFQAGLADFDFWLRADGHRRNPGTTADLIAAGLFVLIADGRMNAQAVRRLLQGCRCDPERRSRPS